MASYSFDRLSTLLFLVSVLALTNCKSTFQKAGQGLSEGAVEGLTEKDAEIDSLVSGIVASLRDELLGDSTRQKVDSLLSVVTKNLRSNVDSLTTSVRDSLLGEYTALRLKKIVLEAGDGLGTTAENLREQLLGARTRVLIEQLRRELLGDSTTLAIGKMRSELLGDNTQALVDSLLARSIVTIGRGFKDEIAPQIKETLQGAEDTVEGTVKYIAWALGILAVVLAAVTAIFWRKFSTRKKIMRILTQEIDQIDNQKQYDDLVKNIKARTQKENLESSFKEILKEENLYQQPDWVDKDRQLLLELARSVNSDMNSSDIRDLHEKLEERGLKDHLESVQNG